MSLCPALLAPKHLILNATHPSVQYALLFPFKMILESSQKQHCPSLTEPWCSSAAGPSLWAHPDHRNELTLPTTCEKKLLGDALAGRYKRDPLIPSILLEGQSSAKGAGIHTTGCWGTHLKHAGDAPMRTRCWVLQP